MSKQNPILYIYTLTRADENPMKISLSVYDNPFIYMQRPCTG